MPNLLRDILPYGVAFILFIMTASHAFTLNAEVASIMKAEESCNNNDIPPQLEYVMELCVTIGDAVEVGQTGEGQRIVIPITGGTFSGPKIEGTVISGGADYQLYDKERNVNKLKAIYCIRTKDGENIRVVNTGVSAGSYFFTTPVFEASYDGNYSWLNDAVYVCRPSGFENGMIKLKVWKVC